MKADTRKEIRFYTCLSLAYILLMISLFLPPINVITSSVLYATIALLGVGACAIGLDISGILHEVNELKRINIEKDDKEKNETD